MPAPNKQYFHLLSALRGVAAILVVMRHAGTIFAPIAFPMSFMAVDVFFVLSGVVIDARYQQELLSGLTPLHFTWLRIARIYPLYILGCGCTFLTILLMPSHHILAGMTAYNIQDKALSWLLTMFLLPNPIPHSAQFPYNFPAWSLFFELAINILYALIVTKLSTRRLLGLIAICGAGLLACLVFFDHDQRIDLGWNQRTFVAGFFRTGLSFFLGVLIYRFYLSRPLPFITRHSGTASIVVVLAVAGILLAPISGRAGEMFYIVSVFCILPGMVYVALAVQPGDRILPFWKFLGDVSYPVYAIHMPMFILMSSVLVGIFGLPMEGGAPWLGFGFLAVVVIAAAILDKLYDRPMQRRLRSLWREEPAPAGLPDNVQRP